MRLRSPSPAVHTIAMAPARVEPVTRAVADAALALAEAHGANARREARARARQAAARENLSAWARWRAAERLLGVLAAEAGAGARH